MKKFFLSALTSTLLFGSSTFAMDPDQFFGNPLIHAHVCHFQGQHEKEVQLYQNMIENPNFHSVLDVGIAHNNLGECYLRGKGTAINPKEAMKHFEISAERGNMIGEYNWGLHCCNGTYTPPDLAKGVMFLQRAADQGDPEAQSAVKQIFDELKEDAKNGDADAGILLEILSPENKWTGFNSPETYLKKSSNK